MLPVEVSSYELNSAGDLFVCDISYIYHEIGRNCVFVFKTSETGMDFHTRVFDVCSQVMTLIQVSEIYVVFSQI